jgi:hypothetical protein
MRADYQRKHPGRFRGQSAAGRHRFDGLAADQVRVASGNPVMVFNICGNHFRLVCAIHYNTGKVFLLRFLTHAEYDQDRWKNEL